MFLSSMRTACETLAFEPHISTTSPILRDKTTECVACRVFTITKIHLLYTCSSVLSTSPPTNAPTARPRQMHRTTPVPNPTHGMCSGHQATTPRITVGPRSRLTRPFAILYTSESSPLVPNVRGHVLNLSCAPKQQSPNTNPTATNM